MDKLVLSEVIGDVSTITLSRPDKLNAMSLELVEQLQIAVDDAHDEGVRSIIFKGAGKSFCAGFDLSNIEEVEESALLMRFIKLELLLQAVANSPCLTVAFAQGKVFGAGVDLFAACKRRIAAQDTVFRMPGLKFGLVLGTRRFGQIVGIEKARELLQETSSFSSSEAFDMKFVHRIAEPAIWEEIAREAEVSSTQLDRITQASLYSVLGAENLNDMDLANLVRSAARNGLKDRIRSYINNK